MISWPSTKPKLKNDAVAAILDAAPLVGLTPTGRATVRLLQMNAPRRVELREEWFKETGLA